MKKFEIVCEYGFFIAFFVAGFLILAAVLKPTLEVFAFIALMAYGKSCLTKAQLLEGTK